MRRTACHRARCKMLRSGTLRTSGWSAFASSTTSRAQAPHRGHATTQAPRRKLSVACHLMLELYCVPRVRSAVMCCVIVVLVKWDVLCHCSPPWLVGDVELFPDFNPTRYDNRTRHTTYGINRGIQHIAHARQRYETPACGRLGDVEPRLQRRLGSRLDRRQRRRQS